ncbi:MAG: tetratricopeptide repeat protein [Kiritimatiellaeota bacterium]|nr:tetratricopeptide repeat protein [Kiritimatiellota bacterium]
MMRKVLVWVAVCVAAVAAEARTLSQARVAFADGQFVLAEAMAREVYAAKETPSALRQEALELLFTSVEAQGDAKKFRDVLRKRKVEGPDYPKDGRMAVWEARRLVAEGDAKGALASLKSGMKGATEEWQGTMQLMMPNVLLTLGKTNDALSAYADINIAPAQRFDITAWGKSRLDYARLLCVVGRTGNAVTFLQQWLSADTLPNNVPTNEARLLLVRLLLDQGQPQPALIFLQPIVQNTRLPLDVRATAFLLSAHGADMAGQLEQAVSHAQQATILAQSAELQASAFATLSRLYGRADLADLSLRSLSQAATLAPYAVDTLRLRLDVAEALFHNGHYDMALPEIHAVLGAVTEADFEARAQRFRAEVLAAGGRATEASVAFLRALDLYDDADDKAVMLFRAAETLREAGLDAQALPLYTRLVDHFPASPLFNTARIMKGEAMSKIQPAEAEFYFTGLSRQLPADAPETPRMLYAAARLAALRSDAEAARRNYEAAIRHEACPGELRGYCHLGLGLLHAEAADHEEALLAFKEAERLGNEATLHHAAARRIESLYRLDREQEALSEARLFLEKYPSSRWAADVTYWIGRYYFNRQDLPNALAYLQRFAAQWPERDECAAALLLTAKAHAATKQWTETSAAALRLIREKPDDLLVPEARLLHGEALCEQSRFDEAILVFDELIALAPDSPWVIQALGRKGDALYTLAGDTPQRYRDAIAAYSALLARRGLTLEDELNAAYKIGRCHERLGETETALKHYYHAVILPYCVARDKGLWPSDRTRFWYSRAALAAAELFAQTGQRTSATAVLSRMIAENAPDKAEAERLLARLTHGTVKR